MRRQMLILRGLAVAVAVIMALAATALAKMEQYESKVILSLPWGSGPNEIGYAKEGPEDQEGLRYGPTAIDVDQDGNIYILDTVNQRVKVFDQNGELLRSFPVRRWPGALAVDREESVWVLRGHTIHRYTSQGTPIETIQIPSTDIPLSSELMITSNGEICAGQFEVVPGKVVGEGEKGEDIRTGKTKRIRYRQGIKKSGHRYQIEVTNSARTLELMDASGHIVKTINLEKRHPYDDAAFLSEDNDGNIYLLVTTHTDDRHFYTEVWKYDRSYRLIAKVGPIFTKFYTETPAPREWLVVDGIGNVYQLITEKEAVKIVKWSKK